jgi:23S rRNA (adenine2503-C2)-methyltransferase
MGKKHMKNILDYTKENLSLWLEDKGIRSFRADQIFKWLYIRQADSFEQMTDLSKEMRTELASYFYIPRLEIEKTMLSTDATEKFLFKLEDRLHIESVLIPVKDHYTLCVSSQVGCAHGCRFCLTAKGGLQRNLKISEIIAQVRDIRYYLMKKNIDQLKVSNIVFMGMGEPFANYQNVVDAIKIMADSDSGLKISPRRITVSTSGLIPEIERFGYDTTVNLAISLNSTTDELRSRLMPINRKYPLEQLLQACQNFSMKPRDKITFEYILMKDINDSGEDALKLVRLLSPMRAKINLIPFNEYENSEFKRPEENVVSEFLQILLDKKFTAIIRKSKGNDILAACGQLRAKQMEKSL